MKCYSFMTLHVILPRKCLICGRNSVVECQLPKLKVAGSNPVARSNYSTQFSALSALFSYPLPHQCLIRNPLLRRHLFDRDKIKRVDLDGDIS